MIVTVPAPAAVDAAQLQDELAAAGYQPTTAERDGTRLSLTFSNDARVDPIAVGEVVARHNPAKTAELDLLVTKARAVWQGDDTFTQAQAQKILAGLVLVVARYLR